MRIFIVKICVFLLLLAVLYAAVFAAYATRHPPQKNYFRAARDKERMLQSRTSPRLIFVDGSSVAFGFNSGLIARECKLIPVNMGLHLGVGLDFMLQQVSPWIREGDVLVLAPEYHAFTRYTHGDPRILALLLEGDPAFTRYLTFEDLKATLDYGFLRRSGNVLRSVFGMDDPVLEFRNTVYRRDAFNSNGDIISHEGRRLGGRMGARFFYPSGQGQSAIKRLNEFYAMCRNRRIRVFLVHPPFASNAYLQYKLSIEKLENELRQDLTIPILDSPQDGVFSQSEMFDTVYHPGPKARDKRSQALADILAKSLATK